MAVGKMPVGQVAEGPRISTSRLDLRAIEADTMSWRDMRGRSEGPGSRSTGCGCGVGSTTVSSSACIGDGDDAKNEYSPSDSSRGGSGSWAVYVILDSSGCLSRMPKVAFRRSSIVHSLAIRETS